MDLLFPPQCGGCRLPGFRWCPDCAAHVQHPAQPLCDVCGTQLDTPAKLCRECAAIRPAFRQLRSWSVFEGPVRNAIHRLKYRRDIGLGEALAPQVAESVAALGWPMNMVVPVPLGRKRLEERGYNQVSLIARPLSMSMRIAYSPAALVRQQETRSQVGLSQAERRQNVRGAFQANKARVDGRIVLLMDDVATTGSTLSSCAEALYAAGARDVFAFSVSRALPRHGLRGV